MAKPLKDRNPGLWAELTGQTAPEERPNFARDRKSEAEQRLSDAGYKSESVYRNDRKKSRESSNKHSATSSSRYDPEDDVPKGMTVEEYTKKYADAWIRKSSFKMHGGRINQARKDWFVNVVGLMSSAEWDARYGKPEG